ncbi:hypothetical protein QM806_33775, partial [Rhodococcus sp. IEGM 1351]|uniref:hypothetical protein n=1 Tax=Rhodococcus sp. IEGM 1351 TaxID=3047089 RepID=UPI0024B6E560
LFVIGYDDKVYTQAWPVGERGDWADDWWPLPGRDVFDHVYQQIAAVPRFPDKRDLLELFVDKLDLFVIGNNDKAWSTYWGPVEPITLNARVNQTSSVTPSQLGLFIDPSDGIVNETSWRISKNGIVVGSVESVTGPPGGPIQRIYAVNDAGLYQISVSRTGLVDPGREGTLAKQFTLRVETPSAPTPSEPTPSEPTPSGAPTCSVEVDPGVPLSDSFVGVRVFGAGFTGKEQVRIDLDGNPTAVGEANDFGGYSIKFGIPRRRPPVLHKIRAEGLLSGKKSKEVGYTA